MKHRRTRRRMTVRCKRAWLVTWVSLSPELKVTHPVIAIFNLRQSGKFIEEFVWQHYLLSSFTGRGVVFAMNRRNRAPFRFSTSELMDEKLSSRQYGRIRCGNDPFIYARIVTELEVEEDGSFQNFRWKEPADTRLNANTMKEEGIRFGESNELQVRLDSLIPSPLEKCP